MTLDALADVCARVRQTIDELRRQLTMSTAFTFKTHVLLGRKHYGHDVVARWEHVPSNADIVAAEKNAAKDYIGFVLTAIVGDERPGNYVAPPVSHDFCG